MKSAKNLTLIYTLGPLQNRIETALFSNTAINCSNRTFWKFRSDLQYKFAGYCSRASLSSFAIYFVHCDTCLIFEKSWVPELVVLHERPVRAKAQLGLRVQQKRVLERVQRKRVLQRRSEVLPRKGDRPRRKLPLIQLTKI